MSFGYLHYGVVVLLSVALVFCPIAVHGKDQLYPKVLLNWEIQKPFHALIVDKSQQTLEVWKTGNGKAQVVESCRCSTGEKDGAKQTEGDMKTPEGIYFFCKRIDGSRLAPKYGMCAYTTDYPNVVDRNQGRTGYGIWLHGRDKPLDPKPDSNGCISLENQDLIKLSNYIQLQRTPLIIVQKLAMMPKTEAVARERKIRSFLDDWIQDLKSCDATKYMVHYALNFRSGPFRYKSWRRKINNRCDKKADFARIDGPKYICTHNKLVTVILPFDRNPDYPAGNTTKILYVTLKKAPLILAEEVRNPSRGTLPGEPVPASAPAHTSVEEVVGDQMPFFTEGETDLTSQQNGEFFDAREDKKRSGLQYWEVP